jgi:hypothetical protein
MYKVQTPFGTFKARSYGVAVKIREIFGGAIYLGGNLPPVHVR